MFERLRHNARYVVNMLALVVAVLTLPELGATVPAGWLPVIAVIVTIANTVLSRLRKVV